MSASVMCANRLTTAGKCRYRLMHDGHVTRTDSPGRTIAIALNRQPDMQKSLTINHVYLFLTTQNFEVGKEAFSVEICRYMQIYLILFIPRTFLHLRLRFSIASELMVSALIPYKTFNFTTVFYLSFKSLRNSCAKWILLGIKYLVNS